MKTQTNGDTMNREHTFVNLPEATTSTIPYLEHFSPFKYDKMLKLLLETEPEYFTTLKSLSSLKLRIIAKLTVFTTI